jgi:C_GCAxxG_C_C family probable redox protein
MTKAEIAIDKFNNGYNCTQAVVYALAKDSEVDIHCALRVANGFGGGMGRAQHVCGAVSGGIMVLGMRYGRGENESIERHEDTYAKTRTLLNQFEEKFGTVQCRELLGGCNLLTDEGQEMFKERQLKQICRNCVAFVVQCIEEMS